MNQFKGVFGGQDVDSDLDASMNDIEDMKRSMAVVRDLFRDQVQTEFIVATIPNMMAIAESARLVDELRKEEIPVRHVFVNQIQPQNDDCTFCAARHKEQDANMRFIREQFQGLRISTVQSFDREIRGGPALRAMGAQLFPSKATQSTANESAQSSSSKPSAAASSLSSQTESVRPAVSAPVEIVE
jgi:arsenite/tail-anchored protein-transporting ATPase